jgi:hypothetical protein
MAAPVVGLWEAKLLRNKGLVLNVVSTRVLGRVSVQPDHIPPELARILEALKAKDFEL